jgi:hypothetical protein
MTHPVLTMALRAHNKILPMERDAKQYVAVTNADIYIYVSP